MSKFTLLFLLILNIALHQVVFAGIEDIGSNLLRDGRKVVLDNAKETLLQFKQDNHSYKFPFDIEEVVETLEGPKAQLYIFVSTSMPIEVIRTYYKEASKYNGVLVFRGLPNDSFKELQLLITSLKTSDSVRQTTLKGKKEAGVIIDDELFKKFSITSVPVTLLVKKEECFEYSSCKTTYDLITGNIMAEYALERFSREGDLKEEAFHLLVTGKKGL